MRDDRKPRAPDARNAARTISPTSWHRLGTSGIEIPNRLITDPTAVTPPGDTRPYITTWPWRPDRQTTTTVVIVVTVAQSLPTPREPTGAHPERRLLPLGTAPRHVSAAGCALGARRLLRVSTKARIEYDKRLVLRFPRGVCVPGT